MAASRSRSAVPLGLRVKQLVLAIGAVYFAFVAVTNLVNFIAVAGGYHWTFLNSQNESYIASIGFIIGTEFLVAYTSEGPFRELLVISLLMPVIITVVPDDAGLSASRRPES